MCAKLATEVRNESPKEKNVSILEEAGRVVAQLGGCMTVFCKSGKDRTGMAVTLHQSKVCFKDSLPDTFFYSFLLLFSR